MVDSPNVIQLCGSFREHLKPSRFSLTRQKHLLSGHGLIVDHDDIRDRDLIPPS
jgi:hypothetical protein